MEATHWHNRWKNNELSFDQSMPNSHLQHFLPSILPNPGRVFVPLCGKSIDMVWLQETGHAVTRVELSEKACEQFMTTQPEYTQHTEQSFVRYDAERCTLWAGDFFSFTPAQSGPVDLIYDRAAMIALPNDMRKQYVQHLQSWLNDDTALLLLTIEYTQQCDLPPFSQTKQEIIELYQDYNCNILFDQPVPTGKTLQDRGLDTVQETVWLVKSS